MIRFSAALVVVAVGVLIGGVATSTLLLVYVAIALSAAALIALAVGVALKRDELFGETGQPVGDVMGAAAEQSALSRQQGGYPSARTWRPGDDFAGQTAPGNRSSGITVHPGPAVGTAGSASGPPSPATRRDVAPPPPAVPSPPPPSPAPSRSAVTETRADLTAIKDETGTAGQKAGSAPGGKQPAGQRSSGADDTRLDLPARKDEKRAEPAPPAAEQTRMDMSPVVASEPATGKPPAGAGKSPAGKSPAGADDTRLDMSPVRPDEPAAKEQRPSTEDTRLDLPAQSGAPASPAAPAPAAAAASAPAASAPEAKAPEVKAPPGDTQVAIIPGVPRYHAPNCILIRFMDEEDLEKTTLDEAKAAGCTPCTACQSTAD